MGKRIKSLVLAFENVEGVEILNSGISHFSATYSLKTLTYDKEYGETAKEQYNADNVILKLSKDVLTDPSLFDFGMMHFFDEQTDEDLTDAVITHLKDHKDIVDISIQYEDGSKELVVMPWDENDSQSNANQTYAEDKDDLVIFISGLEDNTSI